MPGVEKLGVAETWNRSAKKERVIQSCIDAMSIYKANAAWLVWCRAAALGGGRLDTVGDA
jgi:hypothetical protein